MVMVFFYSNGPRLKKMLAEYEQNKSFKGETLKGRLPKIESLRAESVKNILTSLEKRITNASDAVVQAKLVGVHFVYIGL